MHARGAGKCANQLKEKLGVDWHGTTPDGLFTLGEMECLGACGTAPMVSVTKRQADWTRYYEQLDSSERIDAMLDELRRLATVPTSQLPAARTISCLSDPHSSLPGAGPLRRFRSLSPQPRSRHQQRLGTIDRPNSHTIESYEADGGYRVAGDALNGKKSEEVRDLVKAAGLRGRGGAGFPAG